MDWTGFGDYVDAELDEENDIIISQSTIESMQLCPARVGLADEPGFVRSVSEPMLFGTLVHKLAERVVDGSVTTKDYTQQGIEELWVELAKEDGVDLHTVGTAERIDASVDEARFALQSFAAWWNIEGKPYEKLDVEWRIHHPLGTIYGHGGDRNVWVGGTPDLVAWTGDTQWTTAWKGKNQPKLYDWKTSGNDKFAKGAGVVRIQSPLYTWLALGEPDEASVPFDYIVWERKIGRWQRYPLTITPGNIHAAKKIAWMWAKQIASGSFPGTPGGESYGKKRRGWHCSAKYCGAWEICPFKGLIPDDVDLNEKINHGW